MRELLGDLRLKVEMIELDCKFCEGLGSIYLKSASDTESHERRRTLLAFAATNFRRAAAHAILLDAAGSAAKLFSEAASVYAQLRMPYALMMMALTGKVSEAADIFEGMLRRPRPDVDQAFRSLQKQEVYMLMFHAATKGTARNEGFSEESALEAARRELQASGASPIGILGLPVGAYLNLAAALGGSGDVSTEEALLPFLGTYNTAIRQTGLNSYHWSRLLLPFHPAEPDILSVLVLTHMALTRQGRSVFELLKQFPLSWSSRTILDGALSTTLKRPEPGH